MSDYRVFVFNDIDHIVDGHVLSCLSDDEATSIAPKYLEDHAAVEVWRQRRRVARISSMSSDGLEAQQRPRGLAA